MNYKTVTKIITILLIIATILGAVNMVFADTAQGIDIPNGASGGITGGLTTTTSNVIGIVQFICYAAAVILLIVLGVKWLVAAPDQKADIKKSAVIYVIGAIMVFAAGVILRVIRSVAEKTVIVKE